MNDEYSFDDRQQVIARELEQTLNQFQARYVRQQNDLFTFTNGMLGFLATIWTHRNDNQNDDNVLLENFQTMLTECRNSSDE